MADVTIDSQVTEFEWEGTTPPRLRIFAKVPFLTAVGVPVHQGSPYGGRAYWDGPCTFVSSSDKRVVAPVVTLPATTDSIDKPNEAAYSAYLYSRGADMGSQYQEFSVFASGFRLDHTAPSTSWDVIQTFNLGSLPALPPRDVHITGDLVVDGEISGDGSGVTNTDAAKLRSRTVSSSAPSNGQVLGWNDTTHQWEPVAAGATVSGGNATQLQGRAVSNDVPLDGQGLVYSSGAAAWRPTTLTERIDVTDPAYGALRDAVVYETGAMTSGGTTVTVTGASFTSAINGKKAAIAGAGASGALLVGTISGASGTTFTLSVAASTTVSSAVVVVFTDDTAAIKAAIAAADASPSVKVVYLPPGNYGLATSGGLGELPAGVILEGVNPTPLSSMGYRDGGSYSPHESKPTDGQCSTLLVMCNEGTAPGRFLHVRSNAAVRNLTMVWPGNLNPALTSPKVYPWAIELYGSNPSAENLQLYNAYQGIYSHVGERHNVRNVVGQALRTGLYASQLLDTSRFENISFHPIFTYLSGAPGSGANVTPLANYMQLNATAFKFGRVDNVTADSLFNYACATAFKFVVDSAEVTDYAGGTGAPGGRAWGEFVNCGCDGNVQSVDIDDVQGSNSPVTGTGVVFTGCMFNGGIAYPSGVSPLPATTYSFLVRSTFTGSLAVVGCEFQLGPTVQVSCIGTGTLRLIGNRIKGWLGAGAGFDLYGTGGATPLTAIITGNELAGTVGTALHIADNVAGVFGSNVFAQAEASAVVRTGTGNALLDTGNRYSDNYLFQALTLSGAWTNASAANAGYVKRGERVELQGIVAGGTGQIAVALPAHLRPYVTKFMSTDSGGSHAVVSISTAGVLALAAGPNTGVGLDGLWWSVR